MGRAGNAMDGSARPALARRLAAVLALLSAAGALVAIVALLASDVWRLIVVLIAAAVAVAGLWYVVTRRQAGRVVGAIVAVAAIVAVFVVVITGSQGVFGAILPVALIVLSAGAARYALHRDVRTLKAAPVSGTRTSRPTHPVLLMNPKSGGGKAEKFNLAEECRQRGIEAVVLRPGDDLLQLAEDAIGRGADVIGMAGGDGSQALVATVASMHDIPHVCIPAGTRNHFALDLGLDRNNVVGALDAFIDGVERRVDLARVNGRVFVNNASMGLYAKIVQSKEYRDEKLKTAAEMLPEMLGPDAKPFDLRFTGPQARSYDTAHLILVSNGAYELDHLGGLGTRERMDDGMLGVVALRLADATQAVRFASLEAAGRIRSFPGWLEWTVPRFQVDSGTAVEIGIDGEALLMDPPLVFESLPGALRVRVPTHAPGYTPASASVHFTATTLADLLRTVAGRPMGPAAASRR
jgi:diacylglycerol kinase family enzyme